MELRSWDLYGFEGWRKDDYANFAGCNGATATPICVFEHS
jgi:hypothetical protein